MQVNNNCATGSTAMYMAKQFVEGGISECVMALGTVVWRAVLAPAALA
jgi:sterol carrier protein 2